MWQNIFTLWEEFMKEQKYKLRTYKTNIKVDEINNNIIIKKYF